MFKKLWEDYKFTILFGLTILIASIPFNLLLPPSEYCNHTSKLVQSYVLFTTPFNIGCEAPLTVLGTQSGSMAFASNFVFVLIMTALVEAVLNSKNRQYKKTVFSAAILASYLLTFFTFIFMGTKSTGTSIVGVSMTLFLVFWLVLFAIQELKNRNPKGYLLNAFPAAFLAIFGIGTYSAENLTGHVIGGLFFVAILVTFHFLNVSRFERKRLEPE